MRILSFAIFESLKNKRYNNILKNLGVMSDDGNIKLEDMTEKIINFLSVNDNKSKFLKDYDDKIKPEVEIKKISVKVKDLKPSQNEIFLDHILSRMIVKDEDRADAIDGKLKDRDILISSDNHLIDGHHRWATAFILNPNCKLKCTLINLPIKYALPIINAMIEASDVSGEEPIDYDVDLFKATKWKKKKLFQKMEEIIEEAIDKGVKLKKENKKSKDIKTKEDLFDIIDKDNPLKYFRKNMKKINKPNSLFTDREEMPQIDADDAKEIL
jgi:hypothetical protein